MEFSVETSASIESMQSQNAALREVLAALAVGRIPCPDYSLDVLTTLCISLVARQRNDVPGLRAGSWCVAPNIDGMDGDARVEFVFLPTYLVVSILTLFVRRYPSLAKAIPRYDEALHSGLSFASLRGLHGHGFDDRDEMLDGLRVLQSGEVPEYLAEHPERAPDLHKVLVEVLGTPDPERKPH